MIVTGTKFKVFIRLVLILFFIFNILSAARPGMTASASNRMNVGSLQKTGIQAGPVVFAPQQQGCEDIYKPDGSPAAAANILTNGTPQHQTNTPSNEEDWVYFYAISGHHYDIRTQLTNDINEGDTAANDTLLYLYGPDGSTLLAFNDDVGYKPGI